jgi:hypothetical protein
VFRAGFPILIAAACLDACSTPAEKPASKPPVDAGSGPCTADLRADPYAPNLTKMGENGVLSFVLVKSDPAPPQQGTNTFTVKITDMSGTSIGADVRVDLTMADRVQPTTVDPMVTFDVATGVYTIAPLSMHLPGLWKVGLEAQQTDPDAGVVTGDLVAFYFCIESPDAS